MKNFKSTLLHRLLTISFLFVLGILLIVLQFQDPRIDDSYQRFSATIVELNNQNIKVLLDEDSYAVVKGRLPTDKVGDKLTIYRYPLFPHYTFIQGRDCTNRYGIVCIVSSIILMILSVLEFKFYKSRGKGDDIYVEY